MLSKGRKIKVGFTVATVKYVLQYQLQTLSDIKHFG